MIALKYKYIGELPATLIEFHKDVNPEDVIEVEEPINSPLFVAVDEKKKDGGK